MKILNIDPGPVKEVTQLIEDELDCSDRAGAVEIAADNAYAAHQAIGRLCDVLAEANLITAADVYYIATGIGSSSHEFIKDES